MDMSREYTWGRWIGWVLTIGQAYLTKRATMDGTTWIRACSSYFAIQGWKCLWWKTTTLLQPRIPIDTMLYTSPFIWLVCFLIYLRPSSLPFLFLQFLWNNIECSIVYHLNICKVWIICFISVLVTFKKAHYNFGSLLRLFLPCASDYASMPDCTIWYTVWMNMTSIAHSSVMLHMLVASREQSACYT